MYESYIASLVKSFTHSGILFFFAKPLYSYYIGRRPEALFVSGAGFASHFAIIFQPIQGESSIIGKYPDADRNIQNIAKYEAIFEEMKTLITPELELIDSRIGGPTKELQSVLKIIRKSITKREHKVCFVDGLPFFIFDLTRVQLTDYDRFNNSLTKLRDKKDKSLSDEKNLFKVRPKFYRRTNAQLLFS